MGGEKEAKFSRAISFLEELASGSEMLHLCFASQSLVVNGLLSLVLRSMTWKTLCHVLTC